MKKTLLFSGSFLSKHLHFLAVALLLVVMMGAALKGNAQVYYTLNDGTASASSTDGVVRVGYDGSSATTLASAFTALPTFTAIDYPGNRAFVYEGTANALQIRVINLSNGSLTTTITVPTQVVALRYDAASGYIYYLTTASGSTLAAGDALRKVKPDGTGDALVLASITASPKYLALDLTHGQVIVEDVFVTTNIMKVIKISDGSSTTLISNTTPVTAIQYNVGDDYIYYLTSDGSFSTNGVNDALVKIHPDGTGKITIASSIAASAVLLAIDAGNNRAFIYDGAGLSPTVRAIRKIDLGTGSVTAITNIASLPNSAGITAISVPQGAVISTNSVNINSITGTSATVGGNITQTDESVTERGVVYSSTNQIPVVGTDTKTTNGTGTGSYSGNITSLTGATTYYLRAYATSSAGTAYGAVVSFSTLSNDATLSALSLSSGTLSPGFSGSIITYTASVANGTSSITLTPTRNQANATIKVNGTAVTSGSASGNIGLNVGYNIITTIVTAQDGSTTKTYTVTVNRPKASQTITFASTATKTYGTADYAPGATSSSGLTVSYSSDNAAVATIVSGNIHIVGPGTANITASQAGDANNLAAASVVQALTVNNAAITVTATAASKTYGDADPSLAYSITSGALVGTDAFSGAVTRDAGTNAGTYNITQGTLALSNKYTLTFVSGVLTVNKRAISIQPAPASKSYGDVDPGAYPYFYRVGSLASTDGMTGSFVRDPGETPGTYALSIGTKHPVNSTTGVDQSSNYVITYIPEYLTITKRAITLHPVPATKVYGNADPTFPYQFTVGSLAPGEGMTGTFGRAAGEDVGVYALNLGTKRPVNSTTGVFTDQYYTISIISDNLTITKKTVNVTANTQNKTYGDADPALTYVADALGFSDTFTGTLTRAVGESAGTYAISQGTLALNTNNYSLNFTGSSLTIVKKIINVSADPQNKTYGTADPALTYTADAIVSGDSFTGALTRVTGESAGSYAITQGSLALNSNYTLAFTGNNLSIGQKIINVTANAQSKTYGDADPALTYTADALLGGDTFTGALTRVAGEATGSYAINQGSLAANSNYAINYISNNLTIGKATLSYVATPATKISQSPNPTFTGTVTGFINSDTQASATTGTLSFTSTATDTSPQGSYPINGSGLIAANYNFIQAPANSSALTVLLSPDATLSNITVSQGTLNTPFDASTLQYTVNVDHNTTSIDLTAVVHQANATMLVNGMGLTSGSPITLPLGAGYNYFTVVVTAQDGTSTQSYLVTVNRAFSTNTLLTNITLSGITINPVFDPNTTTYTASVGNLVNSTDIIATAADVDANAQIGPMKISATTPYHFTLAVGDNPISVDGVAQNGDIKHYNITVTRAPSSDASLASLNTTVLTFNEPFSSTTYNYTATMPNNVSQFNFVPVATNSAAVITFNGNPVNYLGLTPTINYGVNTYNIVVTSEDGTATHTYTITVTRTLSSDNNLATLSIPFVTTINEPFDPNVLNYTATLSDSTITGLPLTAYSYDPNATMKINGTAVTRFANYTMTLHGGTNTFNIVVTPQDNSATKTYTLVLTRAGLPPPLFSPDATLAAISVSATGYSHNFNFAFDALTPLNVANKITAVSLHPVTGDVGATTTVNAVPIAYDASTELLSLNVGDNTFDVVVTAADGVHKTTTTLHINRLPAADISLTSLAINGGTLSPAFSGTTFAYTASVPYSFSSLNVTPVANAADVTVTVGATIISAGTPSASVPLNFGIPNRIRVTVTAADGINTQNYTINVTRLAPDATLASLTLSNGTLSPSFSGAITSYTASVASNISNVTVKPMAVDPGSVITVNNMSPDIAGLVNVPLIDGANIITTIVTAPDGATTQTYTVTVTRATANGSSNAALAKLNINGAVLKRIGTTDNYTASVSFSAATVQQTATLSDSQASFKVNNNASTSGIVNTITLNATGTTNITIVITAADGITKRTYNIAVSKTGAANAALASLNISGATLTKVGSTDHYTASVSFTATSVMQSAILIDSNASFTINNLAAKSGVATTVALNATGTTDIPIVVTAEDGITTRNYTVTVSKAGTSNTALASLNIIGTTLTRVGSTDHYTAAVSFFATNVQQRAVPSDIHASFKVNNIAATSGVANTIALNETGSTNISIVVTAEDGITTRTYIVTVNKTGLSNAALASLSISGTTLTRVGATDTYIASVSLFATSVKQSAVLGDSHAAFTINNQAAMSGIATTVALNATGTTEIPIVVTAEDGFTTRIYTVIVSKSGLSNAALASLNISGAILKRVGSTDNYTASVAFGATSVQQIATPSDSHASFKVNNLTGTPAVANTIPLNAAGTTDIIIVVTAENGTTTRTYKVTVSKTGAENAALTSLNISGTTLTRVGSTDHYTASVSFTATSVIQSAILSDSNASFTINNLAAKSGVATTVALNATGTTDIPIVVTAEDGITTRNYTVTVSKKGAANAAIASLNIIGSALTRVGATDNYTTMVDAATTSVMQKVTLSDNHASFTVNSVPATIGALVPIALDSLGATTLTTVVTAEDGITTKTYTVLISKNPVEPPLMALHTVDNSNTGIAPKSNDLSFANAVTVHQALSPNGDGINDVLAIDGIENHTDNHLSIMNSGGQLVYEIRNYGVNGKVFDGHSNKSGNLQKSGTYYYSLEYKDGAETKRKTGYFVLKY